ncbi:hypothetical protein ANN_04135 [Periplaneta americana]|uniref:Uncharacterized protein n=1 Tax=Periplaneta americana TaxID=6978 RepID=A0ABQ8T9B2_PERAM|nr:hypothetical protein ANN_04135 [Periplaneta americana]
MAGLCEGGNEPSGSLKAILHIERNITAHSSFRSISSGTVTREERNTLYVMVKCNERFFHEISIIHIEKRILTTIRDLG